MTDINDLVQDFWRTSSDGADGESFLAMRHLLEILQECFHILEVCFDLISVFATADKDHLQRQAYPKSRNYSAHLDETEVRAKIKTLTVGYRKMFESAWYGRYAPGPDYVVLDI
jgi:hypothetical protein